jgi:hypothetical protein
VVEPDRQIEHHADHRRGDPGEGRLDALIACHGLDEGGAGNDEEEAGQKSYISGNQGTDYAGRQCIESTGQIPGGKKSRVLGNHDQRTGGVALLVKLSRTENLRQPALHD